MPRLCLGDLQCFQTFRNCRFFCTSWILRNFYCDDAHHANYGKYSLNHHLQHCAQSVYQIYSVLKLLEITVCFTHFGFYEISTPVVRIMLTKAKQFKSSFPTMPTLCIWDLQCFKTFRNCSLFCTFGFYEMVMRIMPTMANTVLIIISNIAHTVYIRLKAFWNFSKLQFVLHIFAFTKFLLLWCTSC